MALKGKGKQVASDSDKHTRVTRASSSRRGDKRRRGPGDEAEPPSSSVAAKRPRRRCAGAPKSVDDDARIPVEEEEENQELQPEGDPDNDCVLGEARARQERRFQPAVPVVDLESWLRGVFLKLMKDGEELIPFAPFCRQVREIADSFSSEKLRWTPEALLLLQDKAEDDVFYVLGAVAKLVRCFSYVQARANRFYEFQGCWRIEPIFVDKEQRDCFKGNRIQAHMLEWF